MKLSGRERWRNIDLSMQGPPTDFSHSMPQKKCLDDTRKNVEQLPRESHIKAFEP